MKPSYWTVAWYDAEGHFCRIAAMDEKEAREIAKTVGSVPVAVYPAAISEEAAGATTVKSPKALKAVA